MNRIGVQVKLDAAHHLLRHIAEDYYLGAKTYHTLTPKTAQRAYSHVRLKTLAQLGTSLADALGCLCPHWEVLYHTAGYNPADSFNPFQSGTGCAGCLPPSSEGRP